MDVKQIFADAVGDTKDKQNYSFYLSSEVMERFKALCEDKGAPMSRVLERVVVEFLQNAGEPKN